MPSVTLTVLDDSSIFIKPLDSRRAGTRARSAAFLVMLIIFLFLRDLRSTFIICTSIPISVIGTFALLYFAGYTLNTMTFGGLALGIGMIVDASIVVLENTFRHMEHGKDRMQAAIDGSEEVWSAILASTLTHIAVFVPLLFLTGVSSILFKQLVDRRHVLADDVAVRRRDDRAGAVLAPAEAAAAGARNARASPAGSIRGASASSTAWTSVTAASSTSRSSIARRFSASARRASSRP